MDLTARPTMKSGILNDLGTGGVPFGASAEFERARIHETSQHGAFRFPPWCCPELTVTSRRRSIRFPCNSAWSALADSSTWPRRTTGRRGRPWTKMSARTAISSARPKCSANQLRSSTAFVHRRRLMTADVKSVRCQCGLSYIRRTDTMMDCSAR